MDVRNCRGCGKLFNYISGPFICPACREKMEAKFQEVKKYIQENPGSNVAGVAEACDIDPNQIRQWVREERLEFADDAAVGLNCERCGRSIKSGRFCEACKKDMANGFNSAIRPSAPAPEPVKKPTKESPKMRFLDS